MNANTNASASANIVIREIGTPAEMRAVEQLQKEVWGIPDLDVVPVTQLVAAKAAGGAIIGAFDRDILIGFVYGFIGSEQGRTTHHSHMLAVKPEYRNFNIGYRLKLAQRELALGQGISEMTWTFDPLQSRNAHFNFSRLGVFSDRYFVDFYGTDAASFLHRNGTDRLWVKWPLNRRRVEETIEKKISKPEFDNAKLLVKVGLDYEPNCNDLILGEPALIEIPADINALELQSPETAVKWRRATRQAFTEAIENEYVVVDFSRQDKVGRYLLSRSETSSLYTG